MLPLFIPGRVATTSSSVFGPSAVRPLNVSVLTVKPPRP
jgi:hypothetical protein